ncbi:MAG: SRPBCC family protein [Nitrolancea sp.]
MTSENIPTNADDREIVLTREFDAPRELVWEAWTNPEHLGRWWGPDGYTTTIHEMDVRAGGTLRFNMLASTGQDFPNYVVYSEVVRPERLVYKHSGDDEDLHSFQVTTTFDDLGDGRTRLTMRMLFPTTESRDATVAFGAVELGYQTLRHLAELLETLVRA